MKKFVKDNFVKRLKKFLNKKTVYKQHCFKYGNKYTIKDNAEQEFDNLNDAIKHSQKTLELKKETDKK